MKKSILIAVLSLAVISLAYALTGFGTGRTEPAHENLSEPSGLPQASFAMQLQDSQGNRVSMEQFKGKVIFMNFWASWCPPCVAEMPDIDALAQQYDPDEVVFLMVSLDQDFRRAIQFKERKDFSFEIYQPVSAIPSMYQSQSIPITFIINAKGELALTQTGMAEYNTHEFKAFLNAL